MITGTSARHIATLFVALAASSLLACSDEVAGPADVGSVVAVEASAVAPASVGGEWSWSSEEQVKFPPFVAFNLGIVPEGDNTHARCESSGGMTLVQAGASFSGTATKEQNLCTTNGGQTFQQPQSEFFVVGGEVQGNSLHFSFESATVRPCPHAATVIAVDGSIATELRGTGHCLLPGHPESTSPTELPPPAGTTKTLRWDASR